MARSRLPRQSAYGEIDEAGGDRVAENMHYVYILINREKNRTYVGCTKNLFKRIAEHNKGLVKSSRAYSPYKLLCQETFDTLKEARAKEKYYKSASGRKRLKKLFVVNL